MWTAIVLVAETLANCQPNHRSGIPRCKIGNQIPKSTALRRTESTTAKMETIESQPKEI